ncbi:uncharacterized protein LOC116412972 [Galleria mellonella]|uniref:Uncharacterized protein LOC116412972 n=1 Tax=Galleria mellonella TaxID=7137 RepID=A0A6J3C2V8_GALME|nr:uncharacterized protein LOC116412972 [Galleria mellonella]
MNINLIVISIWNIILCMANSNITELKEKEIKALEREKGDLFLKINKAIDDSVKVLQNSNDSDSQLGVLHMKELKTQIKIINETEDVTDTKQVDEDSNIELENIQLKNATDGRKSFRNTQQKNKKVKLDLLDIAKLFPTEDIGNANDTENSLFVQNKLDQWILERKREKDRIREYSEKKGKALQIREMSKIWDI